MAETHPFKDYKKGSARSSFSFNLARVKNPVFEQIKDEEDIAKTFNDLAVIPYSGKEEKTADLLLNLFNTLRGVSPTLGACHFAIKSFALGKKLSLEHSTNSDYDLSEEIQTIDPVIKKKYFDDVLSNIKYNADGARDFLGKVFDDVFDNGNHYIELVLSDTLGVKNALMNYHHSETVKKLKLADNGVQNYAISTSWDHTYIMKNYPKVIPMAPLFVTDEDGVKRTMIHCKIGNFRHYGRPVWIGAFLSVFRQYQDVDYLIKLADNQFTGQIIIEFEGEEDSEVVGRNDNNDALESGQDLMDKITDNFSGSSDDPESALVMERPYGSSPVHVVQVDKNLNEGFYKNENEKYRQNIFEALNWSERLLGNNAGAFSGDTFESELKSKDSGVLQYFREQTIKGYNIALGYIDKFMTNREYEFITIKYDSIYNSDALDNKDLKLIMENYKSGVKSGVINPSIEDEIYFRNKMKFPEVTKKIEEIWSKKLVDEKIEDK